MNPPLLARWHVTGTAWARHSHRRGGFANGAPLPLSKIRATADFAHWLSLVSRALAANRRIDDSRSILTFGWLLSDTGHRPRRHSADMFDGARWSNPNACAVSLLPRHARTRGSRALRAAALRYARRPVPRVGK